MRRATFIKSTKPKMVKVSLDLMEALAKDLAEIDKTNKHYPVANWPAAREVIGMFYKESK